MVGGWWLLRHELQWLYRLCVSSQPQTPSGLSPLTPRLRRRESKKEQNRARAEAGGKRINRGKQEEET